MLETFELLEEIIFYVAVSGCVNKYWSEMLIPKISHESLYIGIESKTCFMTTRVSGLLLLSARAIKLHDLLLELRLKLITSWLWKLESQVYRWKQFAARKKSWAVQYQSGKSYKGEFGILQFISNI